jgi:hypothetical protein
MKPPIQRAVDRFVQEFLQFEPQTAVSRFLEHLPKRLHKYKTQLEDFSIVTPPDPVKEILERNRSLWDSTDTSVREKRIAEWTGEIEERLVTLRGNREIHPDVSVVIPAHNEEQCILQILDSLSRQQFSGTMEVIIVDNNSDRVGQKTSNGEYSTTDDKGAEIARQAGAVVLEYNDLHSSHAKIAYARQRGLDAARGSAILSTDADTIVSSGWVAALYQELQDPEVTWVGGHILHYDGSEVAKLVSLVFTLAREISFLTKTLDGFTTQNMAFRKTDAVRIGGYDLEKRYCEDLDLARRLTEVGRPVLANSEAARVWSSGRRYEHLDYTTLLRLNNLMEELYGADDGTGMVKNIRKA